MLIHAKTEYCLFQLICILGLTLTITSEASMVSYQLNPVAMATDSWEPFCVDLSMANVTITIKAQNVNADIDDLKFSPGLCPGI